MSFGNQPQATVYHPQIDCPLRVCHEKMQAVFRVFFIFALGIQHELLEDVIIPCDDAVHNKFNQPKPKNNNKST
jgi:hypothetical protein